MVQMEVPSSWKIVKLVLLRKERDQKEQGHSADIGDVEVVRILCYSSSGKKRT